MFIDTHTALTAGKRVNERTGRNEWYIDTKGKTFPAVCFAVFYNAVKNFLRRQRYIYIDIYIYIYIYIYRRRRKKVKQSNTNNEQS